MPRLSKDDARKVREPDPTRLAVQTIQERDYRERVAQGRAHPLPCQDLTCTWHHEVAGS